MPRVGEAPGERRGKHAHDCCSCQENTEGFRPDAAGGQKGGQEGRADPERGIEGAIEHEIASEYPSRLHQGDNAWKSVSSGWGRWDFTWRAGSWKPDTASSFSTPGASPSNSSAQEEHGFALPRA